MIAFAGLITPAGGGQIRAGLDVLQKAAREIADRIGKNSVSIQLVHGVKRVDLVGRTHGGVPTPHVQNYRVHTNPETGLKNTSKDPVRPATAQDLREVRRVLGQREQ